MAFRPMSAFRNRVPRWVGVSVAAAVLAGGAGTAIASSAPTGPISPTKSLCHGKTFKIGYDVFSSTQPFANLVTKGLKDAAAKVGCVSVLTTVDNENGSVAVGNVKTMLNEGANAIIDFNILASYQPAIATLAKNAHVPAAAIVGATLKGYPAVGANNYGAALLAGEAMGKAAKAKFHGSTPYVVVAAEPTAGAIVMQRYYGVVAGVKKSYPSLPSSHVIQVNSDGTESGTYNNALSAFSRIPSNGDVVTTGVNDEVTAAMYKAAQARHISNYLVESFGGDPFGLHQVCSVRSHYIGALYLEPEQWGQSALATVMLMADHKHYSSNVGIAGQQVTASSSVAGCK